MKKYLLAPLLGLALVLFAFVPSANADVYGWSWKKPVDVYVDATAANAPVVDVVAGWTDFRSGLRMNVTTDPTQAEITIKAETIGSGVIIGGGIAGQAQLPSGREDGTPDGVCRITIQPWIADGYYDRAYHVTSHEVGHCLGLRHPDKEGRQTIMNRANTYGFMTAPGAWDRKDIKGLYGRR